MSVFKEIGEVVEGFVEGSEGAGEGEDDERRGEVIFGALFTWKDSCLIALSFDCQTTWRFWF